MSIHISAKKEDIAESILLPGDPLRAKFIAETFLENSFQFNSVRNMFGYTGTYKGKKISVMGTGMGMPSISIYVNELIREYGVKKLVRVGTCGSMQSTVAVRSLVIAMSASTDSSMNRIRFRGMDYAPAPSFRLLHLAYKAAEKKNMPTHVGKIISSDSFYTEDPEQWRLWASYQVIGVDMEAAELYTLAAKYNVEALAILTVSDHLITQETTTPEERQISFTSMLEVGIETLLG